VPTNQAVLADVSRRMLRSLTALEDVFVPVALDDAFHQLLIRTPGLAAKLDDVTILADDPIRLVTVATQAAMVKRVLANPDGILEETTDDYTRRLDAALSSGQIQPTDTELETLSIAVGNPEGAFGVRAQPERAVWDYFPSTSTDTWPAGSLNFGYGPWRGW
jgi:hypothetical protein